MADRTYSETEDSRYGRYINLDILDDLLESIHELKDEEKYILSLDESVETTLADVLKSYLKWHKIKVIPNAKGKNVLGTLHQAPARLVLESEVDISFTYFYDNLLKNIEVSNIKEKILSMTGYFDLTFQSSTSNDLFTAIMTAREYFRHNMLEHKDCVITVNNADMNTISALTNSNSTGLAVGYNNNLIDIETLKTHCKESAEFISSIILPEEVENVSEVCDLVKQYNILVIKSASYEDILCGTELFDQGVDFITFGPVATTEKLHYYLPYHKQDKTGLSLGFGSVSQSGYDRKSIAICKNII